MWAQPDQKDPQFLAPGVPGWYCCDTRMCHANPRCVFSRGDALAACSMFAWFSPSLWHLRARVLPGHHLPIRLSQEPQLQRKEGTHLAQDKRHMLGEQR